MKLKEEPVVGQVLENGYTIMRIEKKSKRFFNDIVKFHTLFLQKGSEKRVSEFNDRKMIVEPFQTTEYSTGSKSTTKCYKSW